MNERTIGQTLADVFAGYDPQKKLRRGPLTNEDYWRGRLSNQGAIAKPKPTLGGILGDALSGAAKKVGAGDRTAQRVSRRATAFLNDATPVGNALMAEEGGTQVRRGLTQGDLKQAAIGAGIFGLSMLPFASKTRKPLNSLMYDESGAIRAWHGSPHDFDRFDMSKIGTGEGAQAYGHGLYFAENKDVAEGYKHALVQRHAKTRFAGQELAEPRDWWKVQDDLEAAGKWRERKALDLVDSWKRQGYDLESTGKFLRNEYRNQPEMLAAIDEVLPKVEVVRPQGRLYEVNINAEPEDFLTWDAPLSTQPPKVIAPLQEFGVSPNAYGEQAYDQVVRKVTGSDDYWKIGPTAPAKQATDALRQRGLLGVRYLDQGSRGAGGGTRNYVVFDDKLVEILNKY